eukprot:365726-Chlamydomonas_euryale.AAC.2
MYPPTRPKYASILNLLPCNAPTWLQSRPRSLAAAGRRRSSCAPRLWLSTGAYNRVPPAAIPAALTAGSRSRVRTVAAPAAVTARSRSQLPPAATSTAATACRSRRRCCRGRR